MVFSGMILNLPVDSNKSSAGVNEASQENPNTDKRRIISVQNFSPKRTNKDNSADSNHPRDHHSTSMIPSVKNDEDNFQYLKDISGAFVENSVTEATELPFEKQHD